MKHTSVSPELVDAYFKSLKAGDVKGVEEALESGVDPDTQSREETYVGLKRYKQTEETGLVLAADFTGNNPISAKLTRLLLDHGADQTIPDFSGKIPLVYHVARGNEDAVDLLLKDAQKTPDPKVLIKWCIHHRLNDADRFLRNPDVFPQLPCYEKMLKTVSGIAEVLTHIHENPKTPEVARKAMNKLLSHVAAERRESILLEGLLTALEDEKTEVARKIFAAGLDVKALSPHVVADVVERDKYGVGALNFLKEQGLDFQAVNSLINPGLAHRAAYRGHLPKTAFLIDECGVAADLKDLSGNTPLHCLAQGKLEKDDPVTCHHCGQRLEVAEFLLKKGASPYAENEDGLMPYELASKEVPQLKKVLEPGILKEFHQGIRGALKNKFKQYVGGALRRSIRSSPPRCQP